MSDLADCCHCAATPAADLADVAIALKDSQRTWQIVDTLRHIVDTSQEDVRWTQRTYGHHFDGYTA